MIGFLTRHKKEAYNYRGHLYASSMTVLAAWGYGILAGAAPFLLAGRLGVVQAPVSYTHLDVYKRQV